MTIGRGGGKSEGVWCVCLKRRVVVVVFGCFWS